MLIISTVFDHIDWNDLR